MQMSKEKQTLKFGAQMEKAGCCPKKTKSTPKKSEPKHSYKIDITDLILPSNETDATESARDIYGRLKKTGEYFKRPSNGYDLVRVFQSDEKIQLQTITPETFRTVVERIGTLKKHKKSKWETGLFHAKCTLEDARAILACQEIEQLDQLDSIRNYPILALIDGRPQLLEMGYNPNMRIYIASSLLELRTDLPIDEAVRRLEELLQDYEFSTPENKARAFAALLTPALRIGGFIPKSEHIPMFVVEADQSQTGKSLFVRTVAACYGEKCDIATQQYRGVTSLDESIMSSLMDAASFICIDNFRGEMDSPALESLVTSPEGSKNRVAYGKMTEVSSRKTMLFITSNGMKTKGSDGANRMCMIQIQKRANDYPYREYEEGGLDVWAKANSSYFLSAIYSIITKHYENGGNRSKSAGGHSFSYWAKLLNAIITETMEIRIEHIMTGHSEAQARVGSETMRLLNELVSVIHDEKKLGIPMKTEDLVRMAWDNNITIQSERDPISFEQAIPNLGRLLKSTFGSVDTLNLQGGYTVKRTVKQECNINRNKRLVNYYTFYDPMHPDAS